MKKGPAMSPRTIFRERAIEEYRRRREKDIVPRLVSKPIILCAWILLGVLVGATVIAWSVRVPTYLSASGLIVGPGALQPANDEPVAVLFVPPVQSSEVRVGRPVKMQIGSSDTYTQGAVAKVEPAAISPEAARKRYQLDAGSDLITQPSVVATVRIEQAPSSTAYAGSRITAQVSSGSQRPLALVPGLANLVGGG
jgi:hypothetical protein